MKNPVEKLVMHHDKRSFVCLSSFNNATGENRTAELAARLRQMNLNSGRVGLARQQPDWDVIDQVIVGFGCYKGEREDSLLVTFSEDSDQLHLVTIQVLVEIAREFGQESIFVWQAGVGGSLHYCDPSRAIGTPEYIGSKLLTGMKALKQDFYSYFLGVCFSCVDKATYEAAHADYLRTICEADNPELAV